MFLTKEIREENTHQDGVSQIYVLIMTYIAIKKTTFDTVENNARWFEIV